MLLLATASLLPAGPIRASDLETARQLHRDGQYDQALSGYRQLIDDPTQTVADRGTAANNACVILLNSGLYPSALETCQKARSLRIALDDPQRLARTLNNLAAVLEASGQYESAMGSYLEALGINEKLEDWESVAINFANLGVLATQTGDFGSALSYYDRVEILAVEHDGEPWAQVQTDFATINRGVVLERIGAFAEALTAFRSIDSASMTPDRAAAIRINTGVAYRNLGDPIRALREFDLAAELIPDDDPAAISNLWLDRALVLHLNLHDLDDAQAAYEKALTLADTSGAGAETLMALYYLARLHFDRGSIEQAHSLFEQALDLAIETGALEGQWSALEGLARIALQNDRPDDAYAQLNAAMDLIETTRAGLDDGRLRLEFFGGQRSVYALAVETAVQLLNITGDATYSEAAYRVVQRAKARELLTNLTANESAQLDWVPPPAGELLLEYFFGDRNLYLWVLSDSGLALVQLGPVKPLREAVVTAHTELQHTGQASQLVELSAALIQPAAVFLTEHPRLRIAPDGVLFHLPFELLQANGNALLENHVVSYTPSAAVHGTTAGKISTSRPWSFAGFGGVDTGGHESAARYALPALPGADNELRELDRLLPGRHTLALGSAANERHFLDVLSEGVSIVHVATHTVFDDRLGPAIVLSPDVQSDGLLFPPEIARASLNIDLTVLAACSTAIGGIEDGRAISSLTGALLSAGSAAVLATLWDVDDRYTAFFMRAFYDELARGLPPATALQNTKKTLRDSAVTDATPWAAFVLMGDTGSLVKRSANYYFLAAGLILLLAWWLPRRRLRE